MQKVATTGICEPVRDLRSPWFIEPVHICAYNTSGVSVDTVRRSTAHRRIQSPSSSRENLARAPSPVSASASSQLAASGAVPGSTAPAMDRPRIEGRCETFDLGNGTRVVNLANVPREEERLLLLVMYAVKSKLSEPMQQLVVPWAKFIYLNEFRPLLRSCARVTTDTGSLTLALNTLHQRLCHRLQIRMDSGWMLNLNGCGPDLPVKQLVYQLNGILVEEDAHRWHRAAAVRRARRDIARRDSERLLVREVAADRHLRSASLLTSDASSRRLGHGAVPGLAHAVAPLAAPPGAPPRGGWAVLVAAPERERHRTGASSALALATAAPVSVSGSASSVSCSSSASPSAPVAVSAVARSCASHIAPPSASSTHIAHASTVARLNPISAAVRLLRPKAARTPQRRLVSIADDDDTDPSLPGRAHELCSDENANADNSAAVNTDLLSKFTPRLRVRP